MMPRALVMSAILLATAGAAAAASPIGRWRAVEIDGLPTVPGVETTFELDAEGRVSGRGGCNRYGGDATVGDGAITFGPMMATEMACPPPSMDQEGRYFRALSGVASWRIAGDRLVLAERDGRPRVVFRPAPVGD